MARLQRKRCLNVGVLKKGVEDSSLHNGNAVFVIQKLVLSALLLKKKV